MLDPPVIMPQQPAQRIFFLVGYRLAMQAPAGPSSSSTSTFASFRSRVSQLSVNQP
jgi:hypothetical protein